MQALLHAFMFGMDIQALAIVTLLLGLVLVRIEGNSTPNALHQNATSVSSTLSPWLKKVENKQPRPSGCRGRRWVCKDKGEFPPTRSMCCRNRCVNVDSDRNNCGLCGIRCPFNWQCCGGLCRDTNVSVFNCGKCGHRCPIGVLCFFGMCGYGDEPSPVYPRPPKQKPPPPPADRHQPPATAKEKI